MADDLDARIAQLQGLIGDDEKLLASAAPPAAAAPQFGAAPGVSVFGTGAPAGIMPTPQAIAAAPVPAVPGKEPPRFAKDADDRSIFISGLPKTDETAEEVGSLFAACGPINKVTLLRDRATQQLKGQAYIEFATHEAIGRALDTMVNVSFRGQFPLTVLKKKSLFNADRARGGRGRGRGGAQDPMQMFAAAMLAMTQAATGRGRGRGRGGRGAGFRGGRGGAPGAGGAPGPAAE